VRTGLAPVTPAALLAGPLKEVTGVGPEGLSDKIEAAQYHTEATCLHLTAFVNQVHNGKGIGAQLSAKLIADAEGIETVIGCNSLLPR
jgi:hypothetical protein